MRRILIIVASIALVAGCSGGGGGGGSTPATSAPTGPGSPTPVPGTPTPKPTPTPVGATPSPTPIPTPVPTPTPTCPAGDIGTYPNCQTPTPTPTCPPGDTGNYPNCQTPTPTPTRPPGSGTEQTTLEVTPGPNGNGAPAVVNGAPNMFNPTMGDTPSGGHGPIGNVVDGLPCEVEMSNNYHIHIFVGVVVQGQQYALPVGTGAVEPKPDINGDSPSASQCFYFTHTHDSTDVVHIESDNAGIVDYPPQDQKYILGQWFAVWGINVSYNGWNQFGAFGQYSGPMEVLTSGPVFRGVLKTGGDSTVPESDLTPYFGDPNQIPLWSHEVIWFLIGPQYPATLPDIRFAEQF